MKPKTKKCRHCKNEFVPLNTLAVVCSFNCAVERSAKQKEEKQQKQKQQTKKELMTKSDWIKLCQQVFNKYIRLRDKDKGCISCDTILTGKYDAGHYFSCGAYPNLRFEELNTHGQCVRCNQHLHGNIAEYTIRLPKRIEDYNFEYLIDMRLIHKNYSIPELQELIKLYKQKIKYL